MESVLCNLFYRTDIALIKTENRDNKCKGRGGKTVAEVGLNESSE